MKTGFLVLDINHWHIFPSAPVIWKIKNKKIIMVKDANPNKLAFLKSLGISVELRMKNIPGIQKRIRAVKKVVRLITNDEKV